MIEQEVGNYDMILTTAKQYTGKALFWGLFLVVW